MDRTNEGRNQPLREDFRLSGTSGPVGFNGYDHAAFSDANRMDTGQDSLVQQHFAEEVDINTIVKRFGMTHEMPSGALGGVYGDFTGISDYDSALAKIERAREGFMVLPPDVRERFGNDPGNLVRAVSELPEGEVMELLREAAPAAPAAPTPPAAPEVTGT